MASSCVSPAVPRIVPTLYRTRLFHRIQDRLPLRVNVALRYVHGAVSGQIRQGPRVHVRRPPGEARVTKRFQFEADERTLRALGFLPEYSGVLRALPDRFAVPVELVPPDFAPLVDRHHLPSLRPITRDASALASLVTEPPLAPRQAGQIGRMLWILQFGNCHDLTADVGSSGRAGRTRCTSRAGEFRNAPRGARARARCNPGGNDSQR